MYKGHQYLYFREKCLVMSSAIFFPTGLSFGLVVILYGFWMLILVSCIQRSHLPSPAFWCIFFFSLGNVLTNRSSFRSLNFPLFSVRVCVFCTPFEKSVYQKSKRYSPVLSSKRFQLLPFTFKYFIHLKF